MSKCKACGAEKPPYESQFETLNDIANSNNSYYLSIAYDLGQINAMTAIIQGVDDDEIKDVKDIAALKRKLIICMLSDYSKEDMDWLNIKKFERIKE